MSGGARILLAVTLFALPACSLTDEAALLRVTEAGAPDATATDGNVTDTGAMDARDGNEIDGGAASDAIATPDAIDAIDGTNVLDVEPLPVPAAASCDTAAPVATFAHYAGTTCGGVDHVTLSCNAGSHPDVAIRIDGTTGAVYSVTLSGGLAYALYLGTGCGDSPIACGAGTVADAGGIDLGPYTGTRTDFLVIEAVNPHTCGTYDITVTRIR